MISLSKGSNKTPDGYSLKVCHANKHLYIIDEILQKENKKFILPGDTSAIQS